MKNTAYWGKNTQSALQLCRLVASTAAMEGDSAFFFLPSFLLFYFGSRTLKVIQSGCCLHCCLCKHGGRRKETEQRRKTDQWRQRAGATRASETDQPVWSANQLLLFWQKMIYWLHSFPFFYNRALALGLVELFFLENRRSCSSWKWSRVQRGPLPFDRGNKKTRWSQMIITVARMCWVSAARLAHRRPPPAVFPERGALSCGNYGIRLWSVAIIRWKARESESASGWDRARWLFPAGRVEDRQTCWSFVLQIFVILSWKRNLLPPIPPKMNDKNE